MTFLRKWQYNVKGQDCLKGQNCRITDILQSCNCGRSGGLDKFAWMDIGEEITDGF